MTTKSNILIAYHAKCIDGMTSAWVTAKFTKKATDFVSLLPMNYNELSTAELFKELETYAESEEEAYTHLYVVDFSLTIPLLCSLQASFPKLKITVIDHHKTAFERYIPELKVEQDSKCELIIEGAVVILDNNKCGASLCWEYFTRDSVVGGARPKLIDYVEDYDLWRFKLGAETKYVNKYLSQRTHTLALWQQVANELDSHYDSIRVLRIGKELQIEHEKKVQEYAVKAVHIIIGGVIGLLVEAPRRLSSDIGNNLAASYEQGGKKGFGATFELDIAANAIYWSLRSIGDLDVSKIAKLYGGGGHKNAAGFETKLLEGTGE